MLRCTEDIIGDIVFEEFVEFRWTVQYLVDRENDSIDNSIPYNFLPS